jgi:DNA-binding CsgD family transcriptional regulator
VLARIKRVLTICDYNQAVGFGLLGAWLLLSFLSPWLFQDAFFGQQPATRLGVLGCAVALFSAGSLISYTGDFKFGGSISVIAMLIGGCCIFTSFLLWKTTGSLLLDWLAVVFASVGFVVQILGWAPAFTGTPLRERVITTAATSIAAALIFLVVSITPSQANQTVAALLPLASAGFYAFRNLSDRKAEGISTKKPSFEPSPRNSALWKMLFPERALSVGIVGYGCLFSLFGGIAEEIFKEAPQSAFPGVLSAAIFLLLEIAWSAYMIIRTEETKASLAFSPVVPLIAAGCLLMYFLNGLGFYIAFGLFFSGIGFFAVFLWDVLGNTSQKLHIPAVFTYSWGLLFFALGLFLGEVLVLVLSFGHLSSIGFLIVVCLVVLVSILGMDSKAASYANETFDMGGRPSVEETSTEDGFQRIKAEALAHRFKLSPRETEIVRLIIKGRDIPHICEELYIAQSTARTHVKHIYEKTSVSSRQKLIDLADSVFKENR